MSDIQSEAQSLSPSAIVELFTLDASSIGGPILHFVRGSTDIGAVHFGGVKYEPADVEFTGLETSGVGALPTPTIRVANSDGVFQAIINTWGDLLGCVFYRVRTYARFLDGSDDADPEAMFGPDIFRVERKVIEGSSHIEWELSAAIDQEGKKIPGRQVIRDTCLWRYRSWISLESRFDYSKAQCPYTGSQAYDIDDNPIADNSKDTPSRRLSCCRARFGAKNPMPFGGFPGAARIRA